MKRIISRIVSVLLLFPANVLAQEEADLSLAQVQDKGDITIEYQKQNAQGTTQDSYAALVEDTLLAATILRMNQAYAFPRDITLIFKPCDTPDASFDTATGVMTLCYGLVAQYAPLFEDTTTTQKEKQLAQQLAAYFIAAHQLGHVLMQEFHFPQDAMQEKFFLQYILMLQADEAQSADVAKQLARAFITNEQKSTVALQALAYAQLHPFAAQDARNLLCMVYGLDPQKHGAYVKEGLLNKERADSCEYEYSQTMTAWYDLLAPYTKQAETSPAAAEVWQ